MRSRRGCRPAVAQFLLTGSKPVPALRAQYLDRLMGTILWTAAIQNDRHSDGLFLSATSDSVGPGATQLTVSRRLPYSIWTWAAFLYQMDARPWRRPIRQPDGPPSPRRRAESDESCILRSIRLSKKIYSAGSPGRGRMQEVIIPVAGAYQKLWRRRAVGSAVRTHQALGWISSKSRNPDLLWKTARGPRSGGLV